MARDRRFWLWIEIWTVIQKQQNYVSFTDERVFSVISGLYTEYRPTSGLYRKVREWNEFIILRSRVVNRMPGEWAGKLDRERQVRWLLIPARIADTENLAETHFGYPRKLQVSCRCTLLVRHSTLLAFEINIQAGGVPTSDPSQISRLDREAILETDKQSRSYLSPFPFDKVVAFFEILFDFFILSSLLPLKLPSV